MRNLTFILLISICFLTLISCKKDSNVAVGIPGKWNLVNDSLYSVPLPLTFKPVYITGVAGDYFDFRNDYKVYIKEGTKLDTLPYVLTSASTIQISSFGTLNNVTPDSKFVMTANSLTITTSPGATFITPAGIYYRVVHLSR